MTESKANDLGMELIDRAALSETTKDVTFSAVAWFIHALYKSGYEIVPRLPTVTLGDIERMKEDGINF
jgi:hypothetical protein